MLPSGGRISDSRSRAPFEATFYPDAKRIESYSFKVVALYRRLGLVTFDATARLRITPRPFSSTPDPSALVSDSSGLTYPINELMVGLHDGTDANVATQLARQLGGSVSGYSPSGNVYTLQVSTTTDLALASAIDQVRRDPRVYASSRNLRLEPFQNSAPIRNDLSNLRGQDVTLTAAYDRIALREAWAFTRDVNHPLGSPSIGIIDSEPDTSHAEFLGVDFGSTPAITNPHFHGTSVAGIIGANNLSATQVLQPLSPQMNGVVAGIPDASSPAGSRVRYKLEWRPSGDFFSLGYDIAVVISELAAAGVRVVNMSVGVGLCTTDCRGTQHPVTEDEFVNYQRLWTSILSHHPNILFVASAGNDATDALFNIPGGGLYLSNVVNVAATGVADQRASFSNVGDRITLAAPGVDVYAPTTGHAYDRHFGGTSAAAPLVTGTVGLMLAINDSLGAPEIAQILRESGDQVNTDHPIGRRLNASRAVMAAQAGISNVEPEAKIEATANGQTVATGETLVLTSAFDTTVSVQFTGQRSSDLAGC